MVSAIFLFRFCPRRDFAQKWPALVTTTFVKPRLYCGKIKLKFSQATVPVSELPANSTTFGITQLYFSFVFKNECPALRIEQNWKWSNKTFPHTLCVVSTSAETTHCGICLTSYKNLPWDQGGSLVQKLHFLGQFSPWKLEFCLVKKFQKADKQLKICLHDSKI